MTAIVAGVAPWARTAASSIRAVSRFCGNGMPWVMIVDSSATTGAPSVSAAATSVERSSNDFAFMPIGLVQRGGVAARA